jgi:Mce-associated membrane protein
MAPQKPGTPTSRRRSTAGIRRPKVAGTRPDPAPLTRESHTTGRESHTTGRESHTTGRESDTPDRESDTGAALVESPASAEVTGEDLARPTGSRSRRPRRRAAVRAADEVAAGAIPERANPRRIGLPAPPRTRRGRMVLAGATVVLVALAVLGGVSWWSMTHTPAARNTALTDVAATTQVSQQLGDAVKTVYSYDFTRLDQNEAAARAVITPEFGRQFDQLFGEVRTLAPQQQAVVTATISQSAVESITGDRAVMLVFLDQHATRGAGSNAGQPVAAAGRLTVTGQRVDGVWKIADVAVA